MAYTYIAAPTKAPAKMAWQNIPLKARFDSVVSDNYQVAQWSPGIWVCSATFNGLVLDDQDAVGAWLLQMDDGTYRSFWYDFSRQNPRGVGTGSPIYVNNWDIDPTFATPADWSLGSGWSIASNKLTATAVATSGATTSVMSNNDLLIAGVQYNVTYTVSSWTSGTIAVTSTGAGAIGSSGHAANGTYTDTITAGAGGHIVFYASVGTLNCSISAVTVRCLDMHIIKTSGWTPSTTNIMKTHDWFDVLANGHRELKRLIQASNSDVNGKAILYFKPILRNYPADATPLTINKAGTYFMLSQDAPWTVDLPRVTDGVTITLIEDTQA